MNALAKSFGLRGTDHGHVLGAGVSLQVVVDTLHQRVLGTYHHQVDTFLYHEGLDGLKVISLYRHVLAAVAGTGITWGDVEFITFLTLSNFPS